MPKKKYTISILLLFILFFSLNLNCQKEKLEPKKETIKETKKETKKLEKNEASAEQKVAVSGDVKQLLQDVVIKTDPSLADVPDFTLKGVDGNTYKLKELQGKVIFLNIWATWCPPCVAEMPDMQKLSDAMKGEPFIMLAVNSGESPDRVKKFLRENKYTYPLLLDSDREFTGSLNIRGIPATFIINKKGKTIVKLVGARDWGSKQSIELFKKLCKE